MKHLLHSLPVERNSGTCLTRRVQMGFSVFALESNSMLSIVAFPPCFAEKLSGGSKFGSRLFENIQSVARKRV